MKEYLHIGYIKRIIEADQINWTQFKQLDGSFKCSLCSKRTKTKNAVQQYFGWSHKDHKGIVLKMIKSSTTDTSSVTRKVLNSLEKREHCEEPEDDDTRMLAEVISKEVMSKGSTMGLDKEVGPALQITVDVPGEGERTVKVSEGSTLVRMIKTNIVDLESTTTDNHPNCKKSDHHKSGTLSAGVDTRRPVEGSKRDGPSGKLKSPRDEQSKQKQRANVVVQEVQRRKTKGESESNPSESFSKSGRISWQ